MGQCKAVDTPNSSWSFCPSLAASYLYAVLFGLTLVAHIVQAVLTRKFYSIVIIISAAMQVTTFVFRTLAIYNPTSNIDTILWFILILIAPLFTNAYVYMIGGRMAYNFLSSAKVFKINAWRFGLYFVLLDIFAFLVQMAGAASAAGNNVPLDRVLRGVHIYMGGIGLQQLFIFCFIAIAIRLHRGILKEPLEPHRKSQAIRLLYVVYAVLLLITVRIIFRLVEWSNGINSTIPNHEVYLYVFDSTPMLLALVLLNIVHPGYVMPGKESDLPSRKQRKEIAKNGKDGRRDFNLLPTSNASVSSSSGPASNPFEMGVVDHNLHSANGVHSQASTSPSHAVNSSEISYGYATDAPRVH